MTLEEKRRRLLAAIERESKRRRELRESMQACSHNVTHARVVVECMECHGEWSEEPCGCLLGARPNDGAEVCPPQDGMGGCSAPDCPVHGGLDDDAS